MRRRSHGFSLAEVLIALAVIGVAFGALALTQVTNLRASTTARTATDVKAAANLVLEGLMAEVLATRVVSGVRQFDFNDYYWTCPTVVNPLPAGAIPVVTARTCTGNETVGDVGVAYRIAGEGGVIGEGVLTITVTATHAGNGQTLTIGDRITCYDIYPSPTSTAPEPCPTPIAAGGGRP
jgi:prepilin-type N-terminal cleavage/methylation domain-containing protein